MKLQESYQELDDHPHSHSNNNIHHHIIQAPPPVYITPTSHSTSNSSSHCGAMSINSSMLHNLSSNNDNNTTLPMTNGVLQQLRQQQQEQESQPQSSKNDPKKKNRRLLWLCLLLLLIGIIAIVIVSVRIVKHTHLRKSSSSSSSSIHTTPKTETMSSTSTSSTDIPSYTPIPPMANTTFDDVTSPLPSASPSLPLVPVLRPALTPTSPIVNTTTTTTTTTNSPTVVVPFTTVPSLTPSTSPSTTVTLESTSAQPIILPSVNPSAVKMDFPNPEELYHHLHFTQKVPNQFRIKMHYEAQYLWQDETIERRWCIECTTCPYNNFDLSNTICDIVHQCTVGNQIWIVNCDSKYGQIFTIRPHILPNISPSLSRTRMHNTSSDVAFANYYYHQIQIVQNATSINTGVYTNGNPSVRNQTNITAGIFTNEDHLYNNLCLTRTETRYVTVQVCQNFTTDSNIIEYDVSQLAQLWDPLVPYHYRSNTTTTNSIHTTTTTNDDITISNTSQPTFTITPGIRLSNGNDVVMVTTTDDDTKNNHTNGTTNTSTTTTNWCLTNQHHPKSEEIVALKPCSISHQYHTGLWNFYSLP